MKRNNEEEDLIGIGSTIWRFDENRRVYAKAAHGASGAPIYREHWRPIEVIGETSQSWLAGYPHKPYKVPKRGPHPGFAFTQQEVDDDCWLMAHRYSVEKAVERIRDAALLRKVAELIGWKPEGA